METNYKVNIAIPPGETIQEMLDELGMTQKELAERLQVTAKHVNKLIKGTASLSHDMALKLESVLNIPASFWNNLEMKYQETLARAQALPQMEAETRLLDFIPYNEMSKKAWLPEANRAIDKIINLRSYFRVASLDCLPTIQSAAFRKSMAFSADDFALASWINQCEIESQSNINVNTFSAEKLIQLLPKLRRLTSRPLKASFTELKMMCADVGISCVLVPPLEKTHVNGVTKWISSNRVMIALTTRGGYEDIFWFTFFHELGHVLQNQKNHVFIDTENEDLAQVEKDADNFASESLIPSQKYQPFIDAKSFRDIKELRKFSDHLGIHIGIVVGRLMKENHISFGDMNYQILRRKTTI